MISIPITGWLVFASRHAAEDAHVRGLVLAGNGKDFASVFVACSTSSACQSVAEAG
jgi:hypothetical protein